MTVVTLSKTTPAGVSASVVFVEVGSAAKLLTKFSTPAADRKLSAVIAELEGSKKAGQVTTLPAAVAGGTGKITAIAVTTKMSHEEIRKATGNAIRNLFGEKKVAILLPDSMVDAAAAIAEAALMAGYSFTEFKAKTSSPKQNGPKSIVVVTAEASNPILKQAVARSSAIASAVNRTRDLGNTPPGHLPPAELANFAKELATKFALEIEVLDEKALARKGYGGILGVGQGSARPPRLIRLAYRPKGAVAHLSLVGKGITFDTGGISIKPHLGMHEMKGDMLGAAAVLNAIAAIAELKIPINVTAYAATAENMPSGTAQRPGDVITAYGGRTVEVLNTDAEGRLVLMDALVRAQEDNPDLLIDVATLTGAQAVALGRRISAVLSPKGELSEQFLDAAKRSGEAFWPLPLPAEYRPKLDSSVADIANIAEAYGSTLYGGLFLQDFVSDKQAWIHLDIAAPAFNSEGAYDYTPKGATGVSVRTLVTIAEDLAASSWNL
jgi:leucyl aminopeptidase